MSKQDYFNNAISNFTFEVASGGAIRHLADLGYTVKQIKERLDFPTPYEKVQKAVWEHLLDKGILLVEEPGSGRRREQVTYVRDYDQYGKPSFRRVVHSSGDAAQEGGICWREAAFSQGAGESLAACLWKKCEQGGGDASYVSCDFGLRSKREPELFMESLQPLNEQQRDYILGLPWERKMVYHRLDQRMREIVVKLYESGGYQGSCYFMKTQEKLILLPI